KFTVGHRWTVVRRAFTIRAVTTRAKLCIGGFTGAWFGGGQVHNCIFRRNRDRRVGSNCRRILDDFGHSGGLAGSADIFRLGAYEGDNVLNLLVGETWIATTRGHVYPRRVEFIPHWTTRDDELQQFFVAQAVYEFTSDQVFAETGDAPRVQTMTRGTGCAVKCLPVLYVRRVVAGDLYDLLCWCRRDFRRCLGWRDSDSNRCSWLHGQQNGDHQTKCPE